MPLAPKYEPKKYEREVYQLWKIRFREKQTTLQAKNNHLDLTSSFSTPEIESTISSSTINFYKKQIETKTTDIKEANLDITNYSNLSFQVHENQPMASTEQLKKSEEQQEDLSNHLSNLLEQTENLNRNFSYSEKNTLSTFSSKIEVLPKVILIDIDGVLNRGVEAFKEELRNKYKFYIPQAKGAFSSRLKKSWTGKADFREEIEEVLREWRWGGRKEAFIDLWLEKTIDLDEASLQFLLAIKKDFLIFACTDQVAERWNRLQQIFREKGLDDFANSNFISYKIGFLKKEPDFWQKVLEELQTYRPQEILFIDDRLENLQIAASFGLQTLQVDITQQSLETTLSKYLDNLRLTIQKTKGQTAFVNYLSETEKTKVDFDLDLKYLQENALLIDFAYLAQRLDGQSVEYWKPIILDKLKLLGEIFQIELEKIEVPSSLENQEQTVQVDVSSVDSVEKNNYGQVLPVETYTEYWFKPNPFYVRIQTLDDLLSDLLRLIGLEKLQPEYLTFSTAQTVNSLFTNIYKLKLIFSQFGFWEVITRPFIGLEELWSNLETEPLIEVDEYKNNLSKLEQNSKSLQPLKLLNPYNQKEPFVRDNLFSSLIRVAGNNLAKGEKELKIFEFNQITLFDQKTQTTISRYELAALAVQTEPYLFTSLLKYLADSLQADLVYKGLRSYQSGVSNLGHLYRYQISKDNWQIKIGFWELARKNKKLFFPKGFDLNKKVWFLSLVLDTNTLEKVYVNLLPKYKDDSFYPEIQRSYSLELKKLIPWQTISQAIQKITIPDCQIYLEPKEYLWQKNSHQDIYKLNFQSKFVSYTRTLNGEEIVEWEEKMQAAIENLQK